MTAALSVLAAGVASWLLTGVVRRYALARCILDIPNHRSSHTIPTPRGGGLAIILVALVWVSVAGLSGWLDLRVAAALVGGGGLVAGIGWLDDHSPVPSGARALVHVAAAAWAVAWLGGLPALRVGSISVPLGGAGAALALLGIVWMINMFNFMDGIDGLAGGEAVSAGLIGGALLLAAGEHGLAAMAVLVALASAGFLVWNWAPAKIFMGDVGSGSLGFFFAVLALASERADAVPLLGWGLLTGVFVFDATVTLVRRVLHGERWYEAHHSHAYQRAVRAGWPHARVTGTVLLVNGLLGILAVVGWWWPLFLLPAWFAGFAFLTLLYFWIERLCPMYVPSVASL